MYRVLYTLLVDHPERRNASFRPVPPGTRIALRDDYTTQGGAVAAFEAMRKGEWDYESEYVSRLAVYAENGRGGLRVVRRELRRERQLVVRIYEVGEVSGRSYWTRSRRITPAAVRLAWPAKAA